MWSEKFLLLYVLLQENFSIVFSCQKCARLSTEPLQGVR
uniref:Uncharacterized protein n=1 Tax=Arundo donax TaxID=35708 RepID=A0A0A8Y474_ARUDO